MPATVDSPAAISTVAEIVEAVTERLLDGSRTRMRQETRPLKLSIAGLGALLIATCSWGASQLSSYQEAQREQWAHDREVEETLAEVEEHAATPHVQPEQLDALERRLLVIEKKLDDALAPKVEEPTKVRVRAR